MQFLLNPIHGSASMTLNFVNRTATLIRKVKETKKIPFIWGHSSLLMISHFLALKIFIRFLIRQLWTKKRIFVKCTWNGVIDRSYGDSFLFFHEFISKIQMSCHLPLTHAFSAVRCILKVSETNSITLSTWLWGLKKQKLNFFGCESKNCHQAGKSEYNKGKLYDIIFATLKIIIENETNLVHDRYQWRLN